MLESNSVMSYQCVLIITESSILFIMSLHYVITVWYIIVLILILMHILIVTICVIIFLYMLLCHYVTPWRDCLDMWWIDCTDILSDKHISESNPSLFANMVWWGHHLLFMKQDKRFYYINGLVTKKCKIY